MGTPPAKSHLDIDMVASIEIYAQSRWIGEWWWNNLLTYVKKFLLPKTAPTKWREILKGSWKSILARIFRQRACASN